MSGTHVGADKPCPFYCPGLEAVSQRVLWCEKQSGFWRTANQGEGTGELGARLRLEAMRKPRQEGNFGAGLKVGRDICRERGREGTWEHRA